MRVGLIDAPDGRRKAHERPTPLMGGVALYGGLICSYLAARQIEVEWLLQNPANHRLAQMLLVSGGLFCLVGILDDKWSLRPRTKLMLQIAASLSFVAGYRSVDSVRLAGYDIELGLLGPAFTIFWLVACANVINLIDGLDGLAGTIGFIVCVAIGLHATMLGTTDFVYLPLMIASCLCGFLVHNLPPARIFLGDSGSLMIGFLLGALAMEGSFKTATGVALGVPLVLISVPVFDTCMAILRRKLTGRGISEADRHHIHHCLRDRGLSAGQTLAAIATLCLAMAAVTFLSAYFQNDMFAVVPCGAILVILMAARVFGHNEAVLSVRSIYSLAGRLAESAGRRQLKASVKATPTATSPPASNTPWDRLVRRVESVGGIRVEYIREQSVPGRKPSQDLWVTNAAVPTSTPRWELRFSIPNPSQAHQQLVVTGLVTRAGRGLPAELFAELEEFLKAQAPEPDRERGVTTSTSPIIAVPITRPPEQPAATPDTSSEQDQSQQRRAA